jgi:putative tricarboxylic transport membrane protein
MTFLQDPISAGLLAVAFLFILGSLFRHFSGLRSNRKTSKVTQ